MKKLLFFAFSALVICMLSSCDTEKSRKSKAEDLIKKNLFETLPDFKSYEPISLDLDSIKEEWVAAPGIIDLGWEYVDALMNRDRTAIDLREVELEYESMKKKVREDVLFGNAANAFWSGGSRLSELKKKIDGLATCVDIAEDYLHSKEERIMELYDSIPDKTKFPGWHAIHKFRAKDMGGNYFIDTRHYYLTQDFKDIIIQWSEDDEDSDTPSMLDWVSAVIETNKNRKDTIN